MRYGRNADKVHEILVSTPVTGAIVTYAPNEEGYFKYRSEIIELCIRSMVKNSGISMDLIVFDNASCSKVTDKLIKLKEEGLIQYLILSKNNMGLSGAYRIISDMAQGDLIAFSNDDIFYYPNWIEPLLKIYNCFPDGGAVSGFYLRGTNAQTAVNAYNKGLEIREEPAPDKWLKIFCEDVDYSSGAKFLEHQKNNAGYLFDTRDLVITSNGVEAYCGSVTWQSLFNKSMLRRLVDLHTNPKDLGYISFDKYLHTEMVHLGFLSLSTRKIYVRHIGNIISPDIDALAKKYEFIIGKKAKKYFNQVYTQRQKEKKYNI